MDDVNKQRRNFVSFTVLELWCLGIQLQAPVVQKVDSAIHRINLYPVDSVLLSLTLIRWIVIYLVDSAIQLLKNWGLIGQ